MLPPILIICCFAKSGLPSGMAVQSLNAAGSGLLGLYSSALDLGYFLQTFFLLFFYMTECVY